MSNNETVADIEDYTTNKANMAKLVDEMPLKFFVKDLIKVVGSPDQSTSVKDIEALITKLRQKYRVQPSKSQMRYIYDKYYWLVYI